jgi:hypothetical protein
MWLACGHVGGVAYISPSSHRVVEELWYSFHLAALAVNLHVVHPTDVELREEIDERQHVDLEAVELGLLCGAELRDIAVAALARAGVTVSPQHATATGLSQAHCVKGEGAGLLQLLHVLLAARGECRVESMYLAMWRLLLDEFFETCLPCRTNAPDLTFSSEWCCSDDIQALDPDWRVATHSTPRHQGILSCGIAASCSNGPA